MDFEAPTQDPSSSTIDTLPLDLFVYCLLRIQTFKDLALSSEVCKKWRDGVRHSFSYREKLSFAGLRVEGEHVARLVKGAYSLRELDISCTSQGCCITDVVLSRISQAVCCSNLTSISLWGVTAVTDEGVIQLISTASSLQHFNVGGTFITDKSVFAIAKHCQKLKVLNLWGCNHVTGNGLMALVSGCPNLQTINVWGLRIPKEFYHNYLLAIKPQLQLRGFEKLNTGGRPQWQIAH